MNREIRWGVVGQGRIAEKVVEDFAVVDGAQAVKAIAPAPVMSSRRFIVRPALWFVRSPSWLDGLSLRSLLGAIWLWRAG